MRVDHYTRRGLLRTKTKLIRRSLIIILVLAFTSYVVGWPIPIEKVSVIGGAMYIVEEYEDYYFSVRITQPLINIGGDHIKVITFLPGQKNKMLRKIEADMIDSLEKLVNEHRDII